MRAATAVYRRAAAVSGRGYINAGEPSTRTIWAAACRSPGQPARLVRAGGREALKFTKERLYEEMKARHYERFQRRFAKDLFACFTSEVLEPRITQGVDVAMTNSASTSEAEFEESAHPNEPGRSSRG